MSDVKHRIFFGFPGTIDVDGDPNTVELFRILAENGDYILAENSNYIISENG